MQNEAMIRSENGKKVLHPMIHPQVNHENPSTIVTKGDGVFITDIDGRRMVDGVGGLWNVNAGYNRPEIKEAIIAQLDQLHYYSNFTGVSHPPSIELAVKLVEMAEPENMKRVFFSSGGSDAVETALRQLEDGHPGLDAVARALRTVS